MGLLLCNDITSQDPQDILGTGCGSELIRGMAIIDIVNWLCEYYAEEIICVAAGTVPTDNTWELNTNNSTPQCGDIQVVLEPDGDINIAYMRDDDGDWIPLSLEREFRVGVAGDFADPNNPSDAELTAIFDNSIADHALVWNRVTGDFHFTRDGGLTWETKSSLGEKAIEDNPAESRVFNGATGGFIDFAAGTCYTTGSAGSIPLSIEVGDLVIISSFVRYRILQYAWATNPLDDAAIRLTFTGAVNHVELFDDLFDGWSTNYTRSFIATGAGNINFTFDFDASGTATTDPMIDWIWEASMMFCNITVFKS